MVLICHRHKLLDPINKCVVRVTSLYFSGHYQLPKYHLRDKALCNQQQSTGVWCDIHSRSWQSSWNFAELSRRDGRANSRCKSRLFFVRNGYSSVWGVGVNSPLRTAKLPVRDGTDSFINTFNCRSDRTSQVPNNSPIFSSLCTRM
jgi:hypothetical protein